MLPDRVSNPRPLTYESGALPTALRGLAQIYKNDKIFNLTVIQENRKECTLRLAML